MAFPLPRPAAPELPKKLIRTLDCRQGTVRAVRFSADGHYCITCGSDKTLRLWNPLTGRLLKTYTGHGYEVLDTVGSFDNSQLASCSGDKTVILWDVASGQSVRRFRGHVGKVNCVDFNEESTIVVSGSIDGSARCWDTRSRRANAVQTLSEARDGVSSVRVSPHEIVTGSVDGRVRRYDLRVGKLHSDYIGCPLSNVALSRDGQCVLAASLDSTLRLLDKETGELLGEFTGHEASSYRVECCFSERDTHIVCGSEDGRVCFWDLLEGSKVLELPVGKGVISSLAFHPSAPALLTTHSAAVQLWREESYELEDVTT
uniref:WD repeat domain-containing protein 83-like n=1 Tax=Myxine glutinosa TaxID=7769 RepID=UPI00358E0DDD